MSEPPARKRLGKSGGGADAAEKSAGVTKRQRQPNVRLHPDCYKSPGLRDNRQQSKSDKKDTRGAKKRRIVEILNSKERKSEDVIGRSRNEETDELNVDDDTVIGDWMDRITRNRDRSDFKSKQKRKRVGEGLSRENQDLVKEKLPSSRGVETEKQRETGVYSGGNRIHGNLEIQNPDPFDHLLLGNDDGNDKQGDDGKDSVRVWLDQLGLGKYAPLFEVHEVDHEVLPFLTLEDLKDMGINAVGSRRKMFLDIQKLHKRGC